MRLRCDFVDRNLAAPVYAPVNADMDNPHPLVGVVLVLGHTVGMLGIAVGAAVVAGNELPAAVRVFGPDLAATFTAASAAFVGMALGRSGRREAMLLAMLAGASLLVPRALAPAILLTTAWAAANLVLVTSPRPSTYAPRHPRATRAYLRRIPPSATSDVWAR